jgi:hypothetical protein
MAHRLLPKRVMTRRAPVLILSATLLSLLAPMRAGATITRAVSFDQKVENAASIVLGRCVRQEARWDEARKWILTYSTFQVEKSMKGAAAGEVTIVTPGGRVGDVVQEVIGVPQFRQGDEHVLFVRDSQVGPTVLYLEQGAYRVAADARGERVIRPVSSTAVVVDNQRGVAAEVDRPRTLREFEGRVRDTIRHRQAVEMELAGKKKAEESSILNQIRRNLPLVLLALVGLGFATWQYIRRS